MGIQRGSPRAGRTELANRCYATGGDCSLVLYTNDADSLDDDTVAADLVQPDVANGYAPIVLSGVRYNIVNGVATYVDPVGVNSNPTWYPTGSWGSDVAGAALVFGEAVLHFRDLVSPFTAAARKKLSVSVAMIVNPADQVVHWILESGEFVDYAPGQEVIV